MKIQDLQLDTRLNCNKLIRNCTGLEAIVLIGKRCGNCAHEATLANRLKIEVVQENKVFMDAISTLEINDGSPSKLQRNASGEYQELKRQEVNMIII